ncbi:HlyD family secretion protein [Pedobacter steynii]|uniref:HlyD family secretion protein n=1 Tax=Pedobacter steynii TaxID=430522 RepID=A0A1G9L2G9_9SPHI|nr:HlyD family efflux transporter periplasmic adaptor subunit [Pedobacter steynii]NQX38713.1 HlyD family efflux transporter periplasmic adaptor subunit [Pedobacter steynii]SDL56198.1 HlyD family secretion protein [Pedobacter steynii]
MDREISAAQQARRKTKIYITGLIILVAIALGFIQFKNIVQPSIKRNAFRTSIAESGLIEATVPASGIITPEYEVTISSPVNARIEQVLFNAGEKVLTGQSILRLNKESSLLAFEKLNEEQHVNRNKINQLSLGLQKSLDELKTQYAIKEMKISSLETALSHEQSLLNIGGSTDENVKQARLTLKVAQMELTQIKNQINNQKAMMQADLKSLGYEINIREKDIKGISDKLKNASISSPGNGVITWVNNKIGSEINEGEELVRIADLSSFKVEASISDTYADEVKTGRTAIVRINKTDLRGNISNVQPAVENGTVKFSVSLSNKNSKLLRANLKADVFVITSYKEHTIRVKNGPAFNGSEEQKVFVLEGENAHSRKVKIGESNSDYIEIRSGIKAGESVIISDMQDFIHLQKVKIK